MTGLGEAALAYAAAGYQVFPLRGKQPFGNCPACEPRSPRYRPHQAPDCRHELCHGLYAATSDPGRVGRWWGEMAPGQHRRPGPGQPAGGGCRPAPRRPGAAGRARARAWTAAADPGQHLGPRGRRPAPLVPAPRRPAVGRPAGRGRRPQDPRGYVLLPPSRHPATGQPYRWAEPTLAPACSRPAGGSCSPLHRRWPPAAPASRPARGGRVAEAFNQATSWTQVLGPPRLELPRPGPRRRRRSLAPPRGHQPQERHHPPRPAVRLLGGHPFQPTEAGAPQGYSRFRAYAVLEHGGDLRAAARAPRGRDPVTAVPIPPNGAAIEGRDRSSRWPLQWNGVSRRRHNRSSDSGRSGSGLRGAVAANEDSRAAQREARPPIGDVAAPRHWP